MQAVANEMSADSAQLRKLRMILAEYDIVATGIKTLIQRLLSCPGELNDLLQGQLRLLESSYRLDREAMWQMQVSDAALERLTAELARRSRGADPLVAVSQGLTRIKRVLTPLSIALEDLPERHHDVPVHIVVSDESQAKLANLELLAFELAMGHARLLSAPLRHVLDVTSRCNFRCLTCHQSQTQDVVHYDLAESRLDAVMSVFPQAMQIFVAGMGEPLLSRSAFQLAAKAKESGSYVELITNGTTLGRASRLLSVVDLLMISFDGGTAQSFNAIRRNGSFDRLREGLLDIEPAIRRKLCFNVVVCKQNVFSMEECVALAIELKIGHVHFQEMGGYLPWHDNMLLGDPERAWFFEQLPRWTAAAADDGVSVVCNLVRGPAAAAGMDPADQRRFTLQSLAAVVDTPVAVMPRRVELQALATELDSLLAEEVPAGFRAMAAAHRRLLDEPNATPADQPVAGDIDWALLRDHVEADKAAFPHCMSTFAHLVVNGDGTTRSCCKVQNRLASVDQPSFDQIWNSKPYVELRQEHVLQNVPREDCRNCRDPVRFHFVVEVLQALDAHDVDISLIRKPADFPIPASMADHPLVRALGANALPAG